MEQTENIIDDRRTSDNMKYVSSSLIELEYSYHQD